MEIIDTKITDQWGVNWTPMEIARDFLQNFYDENAIDEITIDIDGNTVIVSAPKQFDFKELLYLGSDKDKDKIGQYGEGFKAATLNSLRNHDCNVLIIIDNLQLEFFFESEQIGKSLKQVVKCRKTTTKPFSGTKLILENCPEELVKEFKFGLKHFYYTENPLFGDLLSSTNENDIFVFKSTDRTGYVFYKKLLRARLDIPLVIVCNREYQSIDILIEHDRDRKAFNEKALNMIFRFVFRPLTSISPIVEFLQPWWASGHKILSELAETASFFYKNEFPSNYYARQSNSVLLSQKRKQEIGEMRQGLLEKKFIECPDYMAKLGMKSIISIIDEKREESEKESRKIQKSNVFLELIIDKLSNDEKTRILKRIPEEELLKAMKAENIRYKDKLFLERTNDN